MATFIKCLNFLNKIGGIDEVIAYGEVAEHIEAVGFDEPSLNVF